MEAEKIIFASHYPFRECAWILYFARMNQERSHVLALEVVGRKRLIWTACIMALMRMGCPFLKGGQILMGGLGTPHRRRVCDGSFFEYLRGQAKPCGRI